MRADDARTGGYGRNQSVWEHQIRRLEAHLRAVRSEGHHPPGGGSPVTVAVRSRSAADIVSAAADDRGVHVLDIGCSEEIMAVRPDVADVLGMDLRPLLGGHLTALVALLTETFGELTSSSLEYRVGGVEDRTMTFERDGSTTTVRAVQGSGDGDPSVDAEVTSRWFLAACTELTGTP
jgi:hypothetical protein